MVYNNFQKGTPTLGGYHRLHGQTRKHIAGNMSFHKGLSPQKACHQLSGKTCLGYRHAPKTENVCHHLIGRFFHVRRQATYIGLQTSTQAELAGIFSVMQNSRLFVSASCERVPFDTQNFPDFLKKFSVFSPSAPGIFYAFFHNFLASFSTFTNTFSL